MSTAEKSVKEIQNQIVEEFSLFDEWDEKYAYLIELGKKLEALDPAHKTEEKKIKGCQSQVWLNSYLKDDKIYYQADSDALIVKGLVSLLVRVFSGHPPAEVAQADIDFIDEIGLKQHLSPTRSNGLVSMVKQMKLDAVAFQAFLQSKQ